MIEKESYMPLENKQLMGHMIGHALTQTGEPGVGVDSIQAVPGTIHNKLLPNVPLTSEDTEVARRLKDFSTDMATDSDMLVDALIKMGSASNGAFLSKVRQFVHGIQDLKNISSQDLREFISYVKHTGKNPSPTTSFYLTYLVYTDTKARGALHTFFEAIKHVVKAGQLGNVIKAITESAGDLNKASKGNPLLKDIIKDTAILSQELTNVEAKHKMLHDPMNRKASIRRILMGFQKLCG